MVSAALLVEAEVGRDAAPLLGGALERSGRALFAGESIGDGFVGVAPQKGNIEVFDREGGRGKPKVGQVMACWAESRYQGVKTAYELWPNAGITGELGQELPMPGHYEQAAKLVTPEDVDEVVACGPDADRHMEMLKRFEDAGYTHLYVHQIGPEQDGFLRFYSDEILAKV